MHNTISMNKNAFMPGLVISSILMLLLSCATLTPSPDESTEERIHAENRIMKQNLKLALRENSVLKEENIGIKEENSNLKSRVKLLESEIISLGKKHSEDIILLNEKYENLSRKNEILEKESTVKIRQLTEVNKALEEKLSSEIGRLTEENRKREEAFNKERLNMETDFAGKEMEYSKKIAGLKNDLLTANTELESLKPALAETEAKLKNTSAEIESLKLKLSETVSKLKNADAEIAAKNRIIENLNSAGKSTTIQNNKPVQ